MTCSHASAPLSTHTLAWRRKHDDFFGTGFLIRSLQTAFAQLASGRVGSTTRPRARFFLRENTIRATVFFDRFRPAPILVGMAISRARFGGKVLENRDF